MIELKITSVVNGYIAEYKDTIDSKVVFEIKEDSEDSEIDAMLNLLWFVKEHFGIFYSKHNQKNIDIKIVGGDK